jgi:hypothetical protein
MAPYDNMYAMMIMINLAAALLCKLRWFRRLFLGLWYHVEIGGHAWWVRELPDQPFTILNIELVSDPRQKARH